MSHATYCRSLIICRSLVASAALALAPAAQAENVGAKHYFDIPAQALNQALLQFGKQSRQPLITAPTSPSIGAAGRCKATIPTPKR